MTTADGHAAAAWRASLKILTGGARELEAWQDQRYKFAHRVGELLAAEHSGQKPMTGPVLYGVCLAGTGLAYVGQTEQSGRRLRDLPIGESHHLANTVPPEIWERVVVVQWPNLLGQLPRQEQQQAKELGPKVCGLVLEHQMQLHAQPPLNSRRRQHDGQWRRRRLAESRSLGAVHAGNLPNLYERVQEAWDELAGAEAPAGAEPVRLSAFGRVVFPSALL
ncbi:hypothetical protein [Streptomyces sp. BE303]|uniref:hypothetical protein n=1 Tax=Streptomyces sp. BE303 TaxID=3002528 RepID=UPI002E769D4D|nr:hypothetical protein [Streptomyces sp. BE303]MED7950723.1 hypothetical protein [Streptomyces sp. BE303]